MITCPSCGTENTEAARFCNSCGTRLGAALESAGESRKTVRAGGKVDEALAAARQALDLYQQKGATFFVEQTQAPDRRVDP